MKPEFQVHLDFDIFLITLKIGGYTINWPITSMGRSNNMWLDLVCHIISHEWGVFATWTSFDSSSFQIDFHLSSGLATDISEIHSPVYALLKSWERNYSRGPGLYVYKSWY